MSTSNDPYALIEAKVKEAEGLLSNVKGVKVFQFKGNDYEPFYVMINNGSLIINKGTYSNPTLTIQVSGDILVKLLNGQIDPVQAYLSGLIKLSGDLMEAMALVSLITH
ncbi:SCP2 sterol-binding domain-containing protein [Caldivirga sp. UBA161]|uniref:SCP2 sterol-binding domain-containing protein n=1 Tax=Caldivirga sp. UBA161 TaxID=1915569 RepID=UPI0025BC9C63|nr:SCP2 sterol-binding domain-containing protein [Caldivirga sp. UBA161]